MEIVAQVIGIIAMAVSICSLQAKTNKVMFICRGISGLLFFLNYLLIGAYTGAVLNLLNFLRSAFLVNKKTRGKTFLAMIVSAYLIAMVLTFSGPLSVIVALAQTVETVVMWGRNGKHIRICQLCFVSPIWLTYNLFEFTLGGILAEVFVIVSAIVSFIRFRKTGFDKT